MLGKTEVFLLFFFPENRLCHFEMSKPVFLDKIRNISSICFLLNKPRKAKTDKTRAVCFLQFPKGHRGQPKYKSVYRIYIKYSDRLASVKSVYPDRTPHNTTSDQGLCCFTPNPATFRHIKRYLNGHFQSLCQIEG